jgi:hypothetical protein
MAVAATEPNDTFALYSNVLELYRLRWQIEMKFKTLKSVIHLARVPSRTVEGLRVHVLAKLLIALLIDLHIHQAESFPPWGYPLAASQRLAPGSAPSSPIHPDDHPIHSHLPPHRFRTRHFSLPKRRRRYQRFDARFASARVS